MDNPKAYTSIPRTVYAMKLTKKHENRFIEWLDANDCVVADFKRSIMRGTLTISTTDSHLRFVSSMLVTR